MNYERPTEKGRAPRREDYWAQLCRDDATSHGATLTSPAFDNEAELVAWIRDNRRKGDEIAGFRRVIGPGGHKDQRLWREDEPRADPARLATLLEKMRATLTKARPRSDRSAISARARGIEARERLEAAGKALQPPPAE